MNLNSWDLVYLSQHLSHTSNGNAWVHEYDGNYSTILPMRHKRCRELLATVRAAERHIRNYMRRADWDAIERQYDSIERVRARSAIRGEVRNIANRPGWVYLMADKSEPDVYKIGRSMAPERRATSLRMRLLAKAWVSDCVVYERVLLARFAPLSIRNENGYPTEWFRLGTRDVMIASRRLSMWESRRLAA